MEKLPEALVFEILSRLDDSADIARCRLAWKTFDAVSPGLRSIDLQWPLQRYIESRSTVSNSSSSSQFTSPLKSIFLKLVSNLRAVESVRIGAENLPRHVSNGEVEEDKADDLYLTDGGFAREWLPRASRSLKSLSISDFWIQSRWRRSNVLSLISAYCHNLVELELKNSWLSVDKLNPLSMLTSLTLEFIRLDDKDLSQLNECFPNLEVLNLRDVTGLKLAMIRLLKLKTCHWTITDSPSYLNLITPNLITLRLEFISATSIYIEAPMLSPFHLALNHVGAFAAKTFENLKTLRLDCSCLYSLLARFPFTQTVENLTLDLRDSSGGSLGNNEFTLEKLFAHFTNMTCLRLNSSAWFKFTVWYGSLGWMTCGSLETFRGYMLTVDPSLTFSLVACVLDQCVNLVEVSLYIHRGVDFHVSKRFIAKCMRRWRKVKWTWGIWEEGRKDSLITDGIPSFKKRSRKARVPSLNKQRN